MDDNEGLLKVMEGLLRAAIDVEVDLQRTKGVSSKHYKALARATGACMAWQVINGTAVAFDRGG